MSFPKARRTVNEKQPLSENTKICVYGKTDDKTGVVGAAKTFMVEVGNGRFWMTPEQIDALLQDANDIKEFVETHRDLVLGAAARKAEFGARKEQEKVQRKEEARLAAATESILLDKVRKIMASGDPEAIAELLKQAG